ncbi:nucleotidyltransferase family protein [Haloarcula salina]|uniref:Nucleotidyltransferase family protein n=1 Tax=Haloarcula salina TaxID=1429914 RepID=A0AA41G1Z0_9EURY|nr:nucleotidyltransferase family protein [Haloarcula salina]MBV0902766.1 nucleotidyltransferase family protein [Haloarcula salina]
MTGPDRSTVGGVVLAAGDSSRYGDDNKLLASVDGAPLVRHVAEAACASGLDDAVVIVGHEAEAVGAALDGFSLSVRYNDDYAEGQSTSVRCGVAFARENGWDAAVFLLGDMPFVSPETVDRIVAAYRAGEGAIVVPRRDGQRGNPVLFDRRYFDALADVSGDRGGRDLIENEDGVRFLDVDDPGVRRDVDTEADLRDATE